MSDYGKVAPRSRWETPQAEQAPCRDQLPAAWKIRASFFDFKSPISKFFQIPAGRLLDAKIPAGAFKKTPV
jgi:hypothetical protein